MTCSNCGELFPVAKPTSVVFSVVAADEVEPTARVFAAEDGWLIHRCLVDHDVLPHTN